MAVFSKVKTIRIKVLCTALHQSATLTVRRVSSLYYATAQNKDIWAKPKPLLTFSLRKEKSKPKETNF